VTPLHRLANLEEKLAARRRTGARSERIAEPDSEHFAIYEAFAASRPPPSDFTVMEYARAVEELERLMKDKP